MAFDRLVASFLVDEVVGGFFVNVPPGHVACIHSLWGGVSPKVLTPGLHFKLPFLQKAKLFNSQILEYTIKKGFDLKKKEALGDEEIEATTADGKAIIVEGSILFKIDKTKAPQLWENIGEQFVSKVVRPVSRSRFRSILAIFTSQELIRKRLEVEEKLKEELNTFFSKKGLIADSVLLSSIRFSTAEEEKEKQEQKIIFEGGVGGETKKNL